MKVITLSHENIITVGEVGYPRSVPNAILAAVKNINLIGSFVGHTHEPKIELYKGIPQIITKALIGDHSGDATGIIRIVRMHEVKIGEVNQIPSDEFPREPLDANINPYFTFGLKSIDNRFDLHGCAKAIGVGTPACRCDNEESKNYDYLWDFGDGTTGSGKDIEHVFSCSGEWCTYNITLTVTNKLNPSLSAKVWQRVKVFSPSAYNEITYALSTDPVVIQHFSLLDPARQIVGIVVHEGKLVFDEILKKGKELRKTL